MCLLKATETSKPQFFSYNKGDYMTCYILDTCILYNKGDMHVTCICCKDPWNSVYKTLAIRVPAK